MSSRDAFRMTDAEVEQFIANEWHLVLGTYGPHGFPHLCTLGYGFLDGQLAIGSFSRAQKIVNLRRDPRLTCLIERNPEDYSQIRGVHISGRGRIVDDPDAAHEVAQSVLAQKVRADGAVGPKPAHATKPDPRRVAVLIEVEKVISWDHTKMRNPA